MLSQKINAVLNGEAKVFSLSDLDWWIDNDMPIDIVSINNPNQVGILDRYLVAKSDHPMMANARKSA